MVKLRPARQTPKPSVFLLLEQARDTLDELVRETSHGIRSARQFDDLEERGAAICAKIRAAFREGTL